MRPHIIATVWLCSTFVSLAVHAQSEPVPLNGFALQQFEPAPAGDRFFSVPDAQARGLLETHEMLLVHYAHHPLRYTLENRGYIAHQLFGHVNLSAVAAEALMLNVDVPFALSQQGDDGSSRSPQGGIGDVRLGLRVAGYATRKHYLDAALQLDVWLPTGDEDALLGDGRARFNPKLIAGGHTSRFVYSANAGFLFRKHRDIGSPELGNAVTFGAGFGVLAFDQRLQLGPELYGNMVLPADGSDTPVLGRNSTPVEAMFGVKLRVDNFVLGAGAARGITRAPGVAQVRGILSLTHTFDDRVLDRDGDGRNDDLDRCPGDPGYTPDGCPPPDSDGDTVFDARDACPNEAGLVHADPEQHGCPPALAGE